MSAPILIETAAMVAMVFVIWGLGVVAIKGCEAMDRDGRARRRSPQAPIATDVGVGGGGQPRPALPTRARLSRL